MNVTDITKNIGAEEVTIAVRGGEHVRVKNLGDNTVYVSKYPDIIIDNDNVIEIPSGCIDGIPNVCQYQIIDGTADYYGTIYAKSNGGTKIEVRTQNNANFRYIAKGGGGNGVSISTSIDSTLKSGTFYQLGAITEDKVITLPDTSGIIEVSWINTNIAYNITTDSNVIGLDFNPTTNSYNVLTFEYDSSVGWVASAFSCHYKVGWEANAEGNINYEE